MKKSSMEMLTRSRSQAEEESWDLCKYSMGIPSVTLNYHAKGRKHKTEEYGKLQDKFLKNGKRELQWQTVMPKMELVLISCQARR